MKKLDERIAKVKTVQKRVEEWFENFDETRKTDVLIKEAIALREDLNKEYRWDYRLYLRCHYIKPYTIEILKPFLDKWPMFKKEARNFADIGFGAVKFFYAGHVIEYPDLHYIYGTGRYVLSQMENGKELLADCKADAKERVKHFDANKEEYGKKYAELEEKVKKLEKYFLRGIKSNKNHGEKLNDVISYLRAKKQFSKHTK